MRSGFKYCTKSKYSINDQRLLAVLPISRELFSWNVIQIIVADGKTRYTFVPLES